MLGILMSIIGLICIVVSLIYINKISKKEKNIYEEMIMIQDNIKDYSFAIENTINSFDDLIGNSLNKIENIQENKIYNVQDRKKEKKNLTKEETKQQFKKDILGKPSKSEDSTKALYEKIIDLKNIGLSNEEIAKKLNKGIREVEIIMKMWGNI